MIRFRTFWWSMGIALVALITALSLLPIRGPDLAIDNGDKLNHAFAYIVLMLYFGQLVGGGWRRRLWVLSALLGYGILIECLQALLPFRTAELADLAANVTGMAIGWLLLGSALGRILTAIEIRVIGKPSL